MSLKIGDAAEALARDYLMKHGLRWITSNYRCRIGEIDLIMHDKDYLVFVEVRARASLTFGGALTSITRKKQQKIVKTAQLYLQTNNLHDKQACRFDVISLEGSPPNITWIQHAFEADNYH